MLDAGVASPPACGFRLGVQGNGDMWGPVPGPCCLSHCQVSSEHAAVAAKGLWLVVVVQAGNVRGVGLCVGTLL